MKYIEKHGGVIMKFKDKNNLVLAISGGLIVLAIIIALIATGVEKKKEKDPNTTINPTQSSVSDTATSTGATTPGKYKISIKNGDLIMRKTPNKDAEQTYSLSNGTQIQVMAIYSEWAYIETNGTYGWANTSYLQLVEKSDAPKYQTGKYIINTESSSLNLREKPNSDSARLHEVPKGKEVDVLSVCGEWGYVKYDGYYGWLSMEFLKAK